MEQTETTPEQQTEQVEAEVAIAETPAEVVKAIVLFTDGSARPNPGNRGFGMHGYHYQVCAPKRGSGHTTHYPSAKGYIPKTQKTDEGAPEEVQIIEYIDLYSACMQHGSNNLSEVEAVSMAIEKAIDYDITLLTIFTDSEYARKGIYDWSHIWLRNNWIKSDGSEVTNKEAWQKLLANKLALEQKGIKLSVQWVKGHRDNYGNIMADKLAEIGVMNGIYGTFKTVYERTPPVGYWKSEVDRHPFVYHNRLYFNTVKAANPVCEYLLGTHGDDDSLIGSQRPGSAYSALRLKHREATLEEVRDMTITLAQENNRIVMVKLDQLYNPTIYKEINKFGKAAILRRNANKLDLATLDEEPLAVEINPPRLAMRAIENLSELKVMLDEIIAGTYANTHILTDITSSFFTEGEKAGKKKLVPELAAVGAKEIMVKAPHKGRLLDLKILLGTDCPDRNTFKKLEDKPVTVKLVTWYESDYILRYGVYMENDGNHGLWAAWFSNMRFVEPL